MRCSASLVLNEQAFPSRPAFHALLSHQSTWIEGEVLIFDDSFIHEVWHHGSEPRYILYCSMWQPQLLS
jgi:aspartyl/asparaginyl beta-hydroxylase (cupin superfamily)